MNNIVNKRYILIIINLLYMQRYNYSVKMFITNSISCMSKDSVIHRNSRSLSYLYSS